jgi:hypothetical protein
MGQAVRDRIRVNIRVRVRELMGHRS